MTKSVTVEHDVLPCECEYVAIGREDYVEVRWIVVCANVSINGPCHPDTLFGCDTRTLSTPYE